MESAASRLVASRHNNRMAFERWITRPPYERSIRRFGDEGAWPKQYKDLSVQLAWESWQEASKR